MKNKIKVVWRNERGSRTQQWSVQNAPAAFGIKIKPKKERERKKEKLLCGDQRLLWRYDNYCLPTSPPPSCYSRDPPPRPSRLGGGWSSWKWRDLEERGRIQQCTGVWAGWLLLRQVAVTRWPCPLTHHTLIFSPLKHTRTHTHTHNFTHSAHSINADTPDAPRPRLFLRTKRRKQPELCFASPDEQLRSEHLSAFWEWTANTKEELRK